MDYAKIYKAIQDYEKMSSLEIQEQIKPIIKYYDKDFLSEYLGVSKSHLFRMCKKLYVENEEKPLFTNYIKIMKLKPKEVQ